VKYFNRLVVSILVLTLFSLIFPRKAHAYLDPGTGSYILQILIAVLIGALFSIKLFWNRIKYFFIKLFSGRKKDG